MVYSPNPYAPPRSNVQSLDLDSSAIELADRGTRLGASLLDGLITGLPTFGLAMALLFAFGYGFLEPLPLRTHVVFVLGALVIGAAVHLAINGYLLLKHGQTVGKRICGIRIVRADGSHPSLWDSFGKRHLPVMIASQIPFIGGLVSLVDACFIFREDRRCLHDLIAGTRVVRVPRVSAVEPSQVESPVERSPQPEASGAEKPSIPSSLPPHLEICPYCAELTSEDTNVCRGCGRNPFSVDAATAQRLLTVDELLRKAHKLYALGLEREALELHVYATRRYSNLRSSWRGLLEAPNAEPDMREEARRELDRLQRTIYG